MRTNYFTSAFASVLAAVVLLACQTKEAKNEAVGDDEWDAMELFHGIMADIYHPYKDSANLAPARADLENFEAAVEVFASSPIPAKVDAAVVNAAFAALRADVAAMKAAPDDATFGAALNSAHDNFHKIMDAWYHAEEGHEHHDHH